MCLHSAVSFIPFNIIYNMTTSRYNVLTLWPHPRGPACVWVPNLCLHPALCSCPFNLICSMTCIRKKMFTLLILSKGSIVWVKRQNMGLHDDLYSIPIYLICTMTTFSFFTFDPTLGLRMCVRSECVLVCCCIHLSLNLFIRQHGQALNKLNLFFWPHPQGCR